MRCRSLLQPNDPIYIAKQQWGLEQIKAPEAWDITTGSDLIVAFLDTGVAAGHPDLRDKMVPGYDFVNEDSDPSDDNGHGTFTAGVAAASTNNNQGVAGVSWGARIMPIKVLDDKTAEATRATLPGASDYATDHGARVVNVSAGSPYESAVVKEAVEYAESRGTLIVAAAGNQPGEISYPAAYDQVFAVGASNPDDQNSGFSSYGSYVDLVAPGVGIWSTARDTEALVTSPRTAHPLPARLLLVPPLYSCQSIIL